MAMEFDDIINELQAFYRQNRSGRLAPDIQAYKQVQETETAQILSTLPFSKEAFQADVASRGIFGAGEAPKNLYRDVYAPVAQGVAGVQAKFGLGLEEARRTALVQEAQIRQQALNSLLQAIIAKEEYTTSWSEAFLGIGSSILGSAAGSATSALIPGS